MKGINMYGACNRRKQAKQWQCDEQLGSLKGLVRDKEKGISSLEEESPWLFIRVVENATTARQGLPGPLDHRAVERNETLMAQGAIDGRVVK